MQPDVFVQSTVNKASEILSKNISKQEKMNALKIIAKETVDIVGVGFYSLGSIRKTLDNNQKKIYSDLFKKYFMQIRSYLKNSIWFISNICNIDEGNFKNDMIY